MAKEVLMPKLGLTMTEGTIEEWKFREGDTVKQGDILFTVATDKLTNDVESEFDGVLLKILTAAGETAECKAVVAYLGEGGEAAPNVPETVKENTLSDNGTTVSSASTTVSVPAFTDGQDGRIHASPYARRTAKERGVNLSDVSGTGPGGRIIWRDVDTAAQALTAPAAPAATAPVSGAAMAGLYTSADVAELLMALGTLKGALTLDGFVEKAAVKLMPAVEVRGLGSGIEGGLPCLREGKPAILAFGEPVDGRLRLNLAYAPAEMGDDAAADFLRSIRKVLENPLSILI